MNYPRIYIALDNCFALKRWIEPETWGRVIAEEIGFTSVQASFDNEIDMLYGPADYRDDWFRALTEAEKNTGLKWRVFIPAIRPIGPADYLIRTVVMCGS